jgi:ketosteroid isomerase-like protein
MPSHLDVIRDYFAAIERRGSFDEVSRFLSPDVVRQEFPNRFAPGGATRGLKELREAAERGRAVIKSQRYEILCSVCEGERVALEVQWTGVLAIPVGKLAPGDAMRARFGVFFEFREGKIARQHNYDCFDAF